MRSLPIPNSIPESIVVQVPEPPQRASLGYILFARQLLSSVKFKAMSLKDKDEQLFIDWNRLSEKEKNEFNVEAEKVIK